MEIRLAEFEMYDRAACPLQLLRTSKHGERAFTAHHRHARRQRTHSGLPCQTILRDGSNRDAKCIHKAREEFKNRRGGYQFHNLLIVIYGLQFAVEDIINLPSRVMEPVGAP